MVIRFDVNGLHFAEMFDLPGVTELLPGILPNDSDPGDEWQEELMECIIQV